MALTWLIAKIPRYRKVCVVSKEVCDEMEVPGIYRHFNDDSMLHPMTNTFIFQTMSIWWGQWGKEDGPRIYARLKLIEQTSPAFDEGMGADLVRGEDGKWDVRRRPLEPADVKQHLGLETNVSNDPNTQAWLQHVIGTVRIRELEADYLAACPAPRPRKAAAKKRVG